MEFKYTETYNFLNALRGMRNPKDSWSLGDTIEENNEIKIGEKDLKLAKTLIKGGSEHRKFLRQIFVSVDIKGPLYWWKEMDTYKIGTTADSTSTMHKLTSYPITLECFESSNYQPIEFQGAANFVVESLVPFLEFLRQEYLKIEDKDSEDAKAIWKELIRWLPLSWKQTRTWTANYEVLRTIYHQRKSHKLTEWREFCKWIESLPYAEEFLIN